MGYNIINFYL